jgi:Protein of unknown function (DUF1236)
MARNVPDISRRERRGGARRALTRGVRIAIVCFSATLVWPFVTAPDAQVDTTRPVPSPSTGVLSNQGAGESQAGKNKDVTPRQNPAVGSGQNSSGEAADIEKSATPLKLTDAQREQIRSYFASKSANRLQRVDFSVAIGAAVPQKVKLQKLPAQISSVIGGYQGDDYLIVGDQLLIVDQSARRVVAIVPNIG